MDRLFFEGSGIRAGISCAPKTRGEKLSELMDGLAPGQHVVVPHQVHGVRVVPITRTFTEGYGTLIELPDCDGTVTDLPGVILTSKHADCIPLFAYDPVKGVIGLAHAGWRGTAGSIATVLILTMTQVYGCAPADIRAVVGPGIGRCCFEVGYEVVQQFMEKFPWCGEFIDPGKQPGKYYIDLKGINAELFRLLGLQDVEISPVCSFEDESCWSYRRNGTPERMLAYISK